jgi:hypothetical protein
MYLYITFQIVAVTRKRCEACMCSEWLTITVRGYRREGSTGGSISVRRLSSGT